MRAALILATLLPLAAVVGWFLSRAVLAGQRRQRRISELESENERLDELLKREREPHD